MADYRLGKLGGIWICTSAATHTPVTLRPWWSDLEYLRVGNLVGRRMWQIGLWGREVYGPHMPLWAVHEQHTPIVLAHPCTMRASWFWPESCRSVFFGLGGKGTTKATRKLEKHYGQSREIGKGEEGGAGRREPKLPPPLQQKSWQRKWLKMGLGVLEEEGSRAGLHNTIVLSLINFVFL